VELVSKGHAATPGQALPRDGLPAGPKVFFDPLQTPALKPSKQFHMTQEALAKIAAGHNICPYFLGPGNGALVLTLVIGDVNRMFDQSALASTLTGRSVERPCCWRATTWWHRGRGM